EHGKGVARQTDERGFKPMKAERWQQAKEVLYDALERATEERAAFLDSACLGDQELRKEVEELLVASEQAGSFFEQPPADVAAEMLAADQDTAMVGRTLGHYRVLSLLGAGGMGSVYQAVRADDYEKCVAIKLIKRGMDTDFIIRRFRHERQILANLDHPNIARLLDGGTTEDGLPYFVMEYVEGQPVDEYCDEQKLSTHERLKLFRQVCAAVHYAHQNLIVHRDIKPGNILITSERVPKLLDFGIAKLLSPELSPETIERTGTALRLMTPEYASPEQVLGETITTASDVYSLGVVLYELLSGHHPYQIKNRLPHEIAQVICEKEPEKPSTAITRVEKVRSTDGLSPMTITPESVSRTREGHLDKLRRRLIGDLDNIVLKALRKEPSRRYASVQELSEDIRRHLAGLPVIARKDTFTYRASKFIKRHKAGVAAAGLVTVALVAGAIGIVWQARIARAERAKAERRFNDVRALANSFLFEFHDAIQNLPGSTPARQLVVKRALEYLDKLAQESQNDPSLQRELATAYKKVGDVQGNPYNANLGDSDGALSSYRKALAISETLSGVDPTNVRDRRDLVEMYMSVADLLWAKGDNAGSLDTYRKALSIREALSAADPSNTNDRNQLARNYYFIGQALLKKGDVAGALESYRKALTIAEALEAADPANKKARQIAAVSYLKIADSFALKDDHASALENHRKALSLQQVLTAADPANATLQRQVAIFIGRVGEDQREVGDFVGSIESERQALAIQKQLADADPTNAQIRADLASTYTDIGETFLRMNRSDAALENLNRAAAVLTELLAANPDYIENRRVLALDQHRIGDVLMKKGDTVGALENYRKALPILESDSVRAERPFELATLYQHLGDLHGTLATNAKNLPDKRVESWRDARHRYQQSFDVWVDMRNRGILAGSDAGKPDEISRVIARCDEAIKNLAGRDK
ncbi:MAG: protein kinase, partial [Pyrinomonadaceae bacterium]